jgi:hypothetical protein
MKSMTDRKTNSSSKDHTIEEWHADNGVRVEKIAQNDYEERQAVIKVYTMHEDHFTLLHTNGGETTEREVEIMEMPESMADKALVGLAKALGYKLEVACD